MKIGYSRRALTQLNDIFDYIARDNKAAALAFVGRIEAIALLLASYPHIGRPTDLEEVRVISIGRYPYRMFYKLLPERNEVRILRIRHTRRAE